MEPSPPHESQSRQIRVFISSTFRDMQEERELLVKEVFPELRRICDERFVSFTEVDLRWGITEEEAAEGRVLPICLEEINTCRPYFIGMLGERYGWIPDAAPQEVLEKEPWIQEHIGYRTSVTELEILHGVLRNPQMDGHAFFYFRDPAYIAGLPAAKRTEMIESDIPDDIAKHGPEEAARRTAERTGKLAALKETIRQSGRPLVDPYADPEALAAAVRQQFLDLIDQLYPKEEVPDPLDQEAIGHRTNARRKLLAYVERPAHSRAITDFVAAPSDGKGFVIIGDSGGGKTALLADFATSSFITHPSTFLFEHYFGATSASASVPGFLHRLLGELKRRADIPDDIPSDPEKMAEALPLWLAQTVGKIPRIVLVLDALNQIEGQPSHRNLSWLPWFFPEHVRVIASSLPGPALEALLARGWTEHTLPLATEEERGRMIDTFFILYHKTLGPALRGQIVQAPGAANPLFLRTVLEELRQFGEFDHLPRKVADYLEATTPVDLFRQVIRRWQTDFHGRRDVVDRSLRHLWAARQGLGESEWLDLLADGHGPMDRQTWRPLFLALATHLVQRSGLWALGHAYLRQAIEGELLPDAEAKKQAHLAVADYFELHEGQRKMTPRKAAEWPFQLHAAAAWERLEDCLTDIPLFRSLYILKSYWNLLSYWQPLRALGRDMGASYRRAYDEWIAVSGNHDEFEVARLIGQYLTDNGLFSAAEPLINQASDSSERSLGIEHPSTLACLNYRALILKSVGDNEGAEALSRRLLAIQEKTLGPEHPDTLQSMQNLGVVLWSNDHLIEAEAVFRQVLEIRERISGMTHQMTLQCVNNLAGLLQSNGDAAAAERLHRRALEAQEHGLGLEHPDTLLTMSNLASSLESCGDEIGAERLYGQTLELSERVLGSQHPNTLLRLVKMVAFLMRNGDYNGAQALTEKSIYSNFGPARLAILEYLDKFAGSLDQRGDYVGAAAIAKQVLDVRERDLGILHPDTLASVTNLAAMLGEQGDYKGAEALCRRAVEGNQQTFGPDHPDTLLSQNNLAAMLAEQGDLSGAEAVFRSTLEIRRRVLGPEHPDSVLSVMNLAGLLENNGNYVGAEPIYLEALACLLKFPSTNNLLHPGLQDAIGNYARCLRNQGRGGADIFDELSALLAPFGLCLWDGSRSPLLRQEPSPRLEFVLEQLLDDPSRLGDISAQLLNAAPEVLMELWQWIKEQEAAPNAQQFAQDARSDEATPKKRQWWRFW